MPICYMSHRRLASFMNTEYFILKEGIRIMFKMAICLNSSQNKSNKETYPREQSISIIDKVIANSTTYSRAIFLYISWHLSAFIAIAWINKSFRIWDTF
jgi:hypothetical protein